MAQSNRKIQFDLKGIGSVLAHNHLIVPPNQREYSWEEEHVQALFDDFAKAIEEGSNSYFLGTIVLTRSTTGHKPEVADGQQRLATTTILIAAIRDYLWNGSANDLIRAREIQHEYLSNADLNTAKTVPKLRLNINDNDYFTKIVLSEPNSTDRDTTPQKDSHRKIGRAAALAKSHLEQLLNRVPDEDRLATLLGWLVFVRDQAEVIQLIVPDHLNAFIMFETLNDRGLRASQADLLKNYLLSKAGDKIIEAQQQWAEMLGALESLDIDDIIVTYLRHFVICKHGPTRERDLFGRVRKTITTQDDVLSFVRDLAEGASPYSALFNPQHSIWNKYGPGTKAHVKTIIELRVKQIHPLMFAVLKKFKQNEVVAAYELFVNWSVRFLIAGGGRGGRLERSYGTKAQEVSQGSITTSKGLAKCLADIVPSDAAFRAAFAEANVSKAHLARYYLRSLEMKSNNKSESELIPNDDGTLNLEHILPRTPGGAWNDIKPEISKAFYKRIGNMVLLSAKQNVALANKGFKEKRKIYKESELHLTADVARHSRWTPDEITSRQKSLAIIAVKTWPA